MQARGPMSFADFLRKGERLGLKLTASGHRSLGRNPARLRTVCAWCAKLIHDGALPVSHGCCPTCVKKHFPETR